MSDVLQSLLERVSIPANLLEAPAPSEDDLNTILQAAVTAPDHGAIRPWRFIKIQGEAQEKLADLFCEAARKNKPDITDAELEAIRQKPLRSPMIIAVVAVIKEHPKAPPHEQLLSAGAAAQHIMLAANALNYGSIWLTGPFASDPYVCQSLGLAEADQIVGFIYLGTPSAAAQMARKKIERRPDPADYTLEWTGS